MECKGLYDDLSVSVQITNRKESPCQLPGSLPFIPVCPTIRNLLKHRNIVLYLFLFFPFIHEQIEVSALIFLVAWCIYAFIVKADTETAICIIAASSIRKIP